MRIFKKGKDSTQSTRAPKSSDRQNEPLAEILEGKVTEIDASDFPDDPPAVNFLPATFMKNFLFVPLVDTEEYVSVAMADPFDFNTQEVLNRVYNKPLKVFKASPEVIAQFIYRWYEAEADMTSEEEPGDTNITVEDRLWDDPEQLKDMASEAPVIRLVNHLISKAYKMGASDIHIEPRRQYVRVRFRIDGVLHDQEAIANRLKAAIISRVKLMAKMDIAEMRLPQDGRIRFRLGKDEIDIRVSSIPTGFGECLVLRLLHQEDVYLDLSRLGFSKAILEQFESLISVPYGMLLVSGPTGSGKTTTLYAALNTINSPDRKIVTVEDPIEYQLEGINQVQVQPRIGLTFANCLRSFLRHDPDIILVGEIRDVETAEIAVQASLTGHMVFSTLHTNDAAGAVTRLEDMGIERFMIVSSLLAVLAQRLVRRVCSHCSEEVHLSEEKREMLGKELGINPEQLMSSYLKGKGCNECGGTGYRGRIGIFELLPLSDRVQRAVLRGADRTEIHKVALEEGMVSLKMDGLEKVRQGITTYEEVLRVAR